MPYGLVSDDLYDHPKFVALDNLEAAGLWLFAFSWTCKHLTDGHIPTAVASRLACGAKKAQVLSALLVEHGLWEEAEGGWQVHDFHHHNRSGAEAKATRREVSEKRSAAGKKGAAARWGHGKSDGKPMANAIEDASQVDDPVPVPVPTCVDTSEVSRSTRGGNGRDPRVVAALEELAAEDLRNATAARRIARPDAYLAACLTERINDDGPGLDALAASRPDLGTDQLITTHLAERFLS